MQFVLLLHETPLGAPLAAHFDLMIDTDGRSPLRAWRLLLRTDTPRPKEAGASTEHIDLPPDDCPAEPLPPHRREYLTYEGPLSGGRGRVRLIDCGPALLTEIDPQRIEIVVLGRRVSGLYDMSIDAGGWRFRRIGDAPRAST